MERIDAVARAILRSGAAELEQRTDIPVAVVIDEYVEIAKAFFDGPEPGFVNADAWMLQRATCVRASQGA